MKDTRPVNLDLTKFKFPVPAIVSILHRISGVIIFIFILFLLGIFAKSLHSSQDFNHLQDCFSHVVVKFVIWLLSAGFIYHFCAGIRHLLMDIGALGETLTAARVSAWTTIIISLVFVAAVGVWLWG